MDYHTADFLFADTETYLMQHKQTTPKQVCTFYQLGEELGLTSNGDKDFVDWHRKYLFPNNLVVAFHNTGFDTPVIHRTFIEQGKRDWESVNKLCEKLRAGEIYCTALAEKIIDIGTHGCTSSLNPVYSPRWRSESNPFGLYNPRYGYADLVKRYAGVDLSEDKKSLIRVSFDSLDKVPSDKYPDDAIEYGSNDIVYFPEIIGSQIEKQELIFNQEDTRPVNNIMAHYTERAHWLAFATARGVNLDPEKKDEVEKRVQKVLEQEYMGVLFDDILTKEEVSNWKHLWPNAMAKGLSLKNPPIPAMPYAKGTKDHAEDCPKKGECECPVKMKKPIKETGNAQLVKIFALEWIKSFGAEIIAEKVATGEYTPTGKEKFKNEFTIIWPDDVTKENRPRVKFSESCLSLEGDIIEEWSHCDVFTPEQEAFQFVWQVYEERSSVAKIVSTEIPRMLDDNGDMAELLHATFDAIKNTGRTSSSASKFFPSFNGQNVYSKIRDCYRAAPAGKVCRFTGSTAKKGFFLVSLDYDAMELCTLAQSMLDIVGYSEHASIINKGWDCHSYCAGMLAYRMDDDFRKICNDNDIHDPDDIYIKFVSSDGTGEKCIEGFIDTDLVDHLGQRPFGHDMKTFFDAYRTFAKIVGLAIPGGMGAKTACKNAKEKSKVDISLKDMEAMFDIYFEVFKSVKEYKEQVLKVEMVDDSAYQWAHPDADLNDSFASTRYKYTSALGMVRKNCFHNVALNGRVLQTPGAEGMYCAFNELSRRCYDKIYSEQVGSKLFGNFWISIPIHDEMFGEVKADHPDQVREVLDEVKNVMEVYFKEEITPDIDMNADYVCMMNWSKKARKVVDSEGRIVPFDNVDYWKQVGVA